MKYNFISNIPFEFQTRKRKFVFYKNFFFFFSSKTSLKTLEGVLWEAKSL